MVAEPNFFRRDSRKETSDDGFGVQESARACGPKIVQKKNA